jgi:ketosteroid isomerase-like protein
LRCWGDAHDQYRRPDSDHTATLARFTAALERRDVDGLIAEITDDVVLESLGLAPDGERYEGAAAVREFFARFFEANPHAKFDEEEVFAAGDRCVVRWRYEWGAGHVRGVDVMRLRDGRICETLGYVKG